MAKERNKKPNPYNKYANIAYQMIGVMGLSGYLGHRLDIYLHTKQPYYTAGLMLFMLITYLWKIIIEIDNEQK